MAQDETLAIDPDGALLLLDLRALLERLREC